MDLIETFFKNWDSFDTFLNAGTKLTHLHGSETIRLIKPNNNDK